MSCRRNEGSVQELLKTVAQLEVSGLVEPFLKTHPHYADSVNAARQMLVKNHSLQNSGCGGGAPRCLPPPNPVGPPGPVNLWTTTGACTDSSSSRVSFSPSRNTTKCRLSSIPDGGRWVIISPKAPADTAANLSSYVSKRSTAQNKEPESVTFEPVAGSWSDGVGGFKVKSTGLNVKRDKGAGKYDGVGGRKPQSQED